jgi:PPM family protein phosphatase
MFLSWSAVSDPGLRRSSNEDAYCVRPDLGLFVVADGMGGHVAGEVASLVAVQAIESFIEATASVDEDWTWPFGFDVRLGTDGNRLRSAMRIANSRIADRVSANADLRGMATTVVALLFDLAELHNPASTSASAIAGHVGDSRLYRLRGGRLEQLTRDHSWVQEQVSAGTLSEEAAREHPWRNMLTRALTGGDDPGYDLRRMELTPGDRILMCSDGLSSVVGASEIASLLGATAGDLGELCDSMVAAANQAGGPDNITVVVLEIGDGQ